MDRLARLIAAVQRLIVSLFFALSSFAWSADGTVWEYRGYFGETNSQACFNYGLAFQNSSGVPGRARVYEGGNYDSRCVYEKWLYGDTYDIHEIGGYPHIKCQAGDVWSDQTRSCAPSNCPGNQQLNESGTACECKVIRNAGSFMVTGDHYDGCNQGCAMVLSSGWYDKTANTTWGTWNQTGGACTAGLPSVLSPNDPKVESAKKCSAGTCPGTVNGQSVCLPCDKAKESGTTTKSESSSTTASGASSPSSSSTSSDTTTTKTECAGGQCKTTTTTTSTGADGTSTDKTTETTQPQSDYCTDNPNAEVCKGAESSWGGTCEAFTCDGDAVQCAQAKGAWELACQLKTEATDSTVQAGTEAIARTGEAAIQDQLGMNTSQVFDLASRLDSTSLFGTPGACPSDTVLPLGIGSVTLPFASMCPQLNLVGVAMMGLAYLIAAFIVFRPGKGA